MSYNHFHHFDGHRVYNGCPDSKLQEKLDYEQSLMGDIRRDEPEAHLTYHFPDGWVVHVWGRELSGYHSSVEGAYLDVLKRRKK